jgi:FkbM family methyltransferase
MLKISGTIVRDIIDGKDVSFFVFDPNDAIQKHHMEGQFYEREELELISKFWRADRAFLDIGSNVGNHAIFASKFLSTPKIIVFECNLLAIDMLRINLLLNKCDNVDTRFLGVAVGAADDLVRVVQDPFDNNLGGASVEIDGQGDTVILPADSVLQGESIGFVKIDVEGLEMEVLSGLSDTIRRWRPHMFIEVMDKNAEAFLAWVANSSYHVAGTIQRYPAVVNYLVLPGAAAEA